ERIEGGGVRRGLLVWDPLVPWLRAWLERRATLCAALARARALRTDGDQSGQDRADQDRAHDVDDPAIQSHDRAPGRSELQRTARAHLAVCWSSGAGAPDRDAFLMAPDARDQQCRL